VTQNLQEFTKENIQQLAEDAASEKRIRYNLPGGGKLNIEKSLPYLLIYRRTEEPDPSTARFVLSESSYLIIGNENFEGYRKLIYHLGEKLSTKFASYLLFEVWAGEAGSRKFRILGPAQRIPSTIEELKKGILELDEFYDQLPLKCQVEDTEERHPPGRKSLLNIVELKNAGCLLVGMEIPPVYRNDENQLFPKFFQSLHSRLAPILHHSFFDFIRVQTSCGVGNYSALGRATVDDEAFRIDRRLCEIEKRYQFLWLVSPSNIHKIKKTFFESNYEEVLDYHYRLLPIDPDLLKRELYNLRIEEIEDPSIAFLFRDKREELDRQITMLNERGTRDFFYNSVRLYKGVDRPLQQQAIEVLQEVAEEENELKDGSIDAQQFAELAKEEFAAFRKQDPDFDSKVHLREDVNVIMVSKGELYIPADYVMPEKEAEALLQHEVGTHVLTYHNGSKQNLHQLAHGLADYDPLQAGIAVLSEYLVGGLTANRLRILAARVVAGTALLEGADFREIFQMLHKEYGLTAERSFNVSARMMQGGGFLKDIIYLKGLVQLREYLQKGGELEPLLIGKIAVKHIDVIKALQERGMLQKPTLLPSYFQKEETQQRLKKIREGLPLHKMVNA